jgi:hypothetical protein
MVISGPLYGILILQILVMMPLWIRVLGARLVHAVSPTASVLIPYGKIVASLVTLILPLLAGLLIARFRPNLATRARKVGESFFLFPFAICFLSR